MSVVVQKYGGSSVKDAERMKRVARRIAARKKQGHQVVVVVSARGDTTDALLEAAAEITFRPSAREMDVLLATGEQISIALLAMALHELGQPAISLTGPQAGFVTDDNYRAAKVLEVNPDRVRAELEAGKIVIVAGFQGLGPNGDITTLGRGGSDATAIALAAALQADACQIYTDVDGVYTADPRIISDARRLDEVSYDEMLELAASGAQVMQLKSVEYAKKCGVEFEVLSSLAPLPDEGGLEKGTRVVTELSPEQQRVVSGVAIDSKVARITIMNVPDRPGIAYRLFSALAEGRINVDAIVQSGGPGGSTADISFLVKRDDLERALEITRRIGSAWGDPKIISDQDVAKVSVVGAAVASNYGVASTMFEALYELGINIELITCSEVKLSCIVRASRAVEAARAIHGKFQLGSEGAWPEVSVAGGAAS